MKLVNYAKEHYLLGLILIVAIFLRLYQLNFQSIWADEISTMLNTDPNTSLKELVHNINTREGFPYLYFIVLKFLNLISYSPITARLFSVIAGTLSVLYIYKLGKVLIGKDTGLIAAILLTVNHFAIYTSQDGRPYSLIMLTSILSFYRLSILIKNPSAKNAVYYGIFSGLMVNTSFFALVTVFSQYILLLISLIVAEKNYKTTLFKYYFTSGIILLIFFVPNFHKLSTLVSLKSNWIQKPVSDSLTGILKDFLGNSEISNLLFFVVFIYYIINIFNIRQIKFKSDVINNNDLLAFIICTSWIFIFVSIMYVKSIVGLSVILHRYFISVLPAIILIIAMGISFIRSKIVKSAVISLLVCFILINTALFNHYYSTYTKTQYRELTETVIKNVKPGEKAYTNLSIWLNYFFNNSNILLEQKTSLDDLLNEMNNNPAIRKAFWYLNADMGEYNVSPQNKEFIDDTFFIDYEYTGNNVWAKHFILKEDRKSVGDIKVFKQPKQHNGNNFLYRIESINVTENKAEATGWAYFEGQDAEETKIELVLLKDGDYLFFNTISILRPDVTTYFKSNYLLDKAGFLSKRDISDLQKGKYIVALYLYNKKTNKEGLILTENFVEKQ